MAKIRVSVGALPLGVEDIEPSVDGTAPANVATPRGSVSAVVPLIFWCDEAGKQRAADLIVPAVDTRVRFSVNGETWGGWGEGVTIPGPITTQGTAAFMQTRGFVTDTTPLAVRLVVPQDGIAAGSDTVLGYAIEPPTASDLASLLTIGVLSALEAPTNADAAALAYGGLISVLPSVVETDAESDAVTLRLVRPFGDAVDAATGSDASVLRGVLRFGAATETDAEYDAAAMDTAPAQQTTAPQTLYWSDDARTVGSVSGYALDATEDASGFMLQSFDPGSDSEYPGYQIGIRIYRLRSGTLTEVTSGWLKANVSGTQGSFLNALFNYTLASGASFLATDRLVVDRGLFVTGESSPRSTLRFIGSEVGAAKDLVAGTITSYMTYRYSLDDYFGAFPISVQYAGGAQNRITVNWSA